MEAKITMMNKKEKIKKIVVLQLVIIIYTFSGVMAKLASLHKEEPVLFLTFFAGEFVILGVYAIFWQQMIKQFELMVAYANRATAILWSMIWAGLFFKEMITIRNILGVLIVLAGTMLINTEKEQKDHD